MAEANVGQVFHTHDGKTVYIDPKTKQATVFDGVKTVEQIQEPDLNAILGPAGDSAFQAIAELLAGASNPFTMLGKPLKLSFIAIPKAQESSQSEIDPLGPKNHYVLVKPSAIPLSVGSSPVRAWVSEHQNGHKPVYADYEKHRILPEQFDWLMAHKDCSVRTWYDSDCPGFLALACQDHCKIMKPVSKVDGASDSKEPSFSLQGLSVQSQTETVSAEEREI